MNKETARDFIVNQFELAPPAVQTHIKELLNLLVNDSHPLAYQLLLCIAIDLNHGLLPPDRYENLLNNVDVTQPVDILFTQFQDAIRSIVNKTGPLFSDYTSHTHSKSNCQMYATVLSRKDADKYYPLPSPTTGKWKTYTSSFRKVPVDSLLTRGYTDPTLSKPKPAVFWLAPCEWVEGLIKVHGDEAASILVDLLGLSHLNEDGTELLYLELPCDLIPTAYQSNTAQARWNVKTNLQMSDGTIFEVPYSPFLSFGNVDGWGRTFSLQVITHQNQGFERVIDIINVDTDEKKKQVVFRKIKGSVNGLSAIDNRVGLISEGLNRFEKL